MICSAIPRCHELLLLAIGLSNGAIIALNALGFTLLYVAIVLRTRERGDDKTLEPAKSGTLQH